MGEFSRSMTGRLMALSFGIALVGGGTATLMGGGGGSALLMSVSLFLPIVINIFALPEALEEHWFAAIMSAIILPVGLWLYGIGAPVARVYMPSVGYGFVVLGLGALAMAARSGQPARAAQASADGLQQQQQQH